MEKKIEVYYDGMCNMCTASMRALEKSSQGPVFKAIDVTKGTLPPGKDETAALHDMHAVDEQGNIYVGAEAILRILGEYPRWRWLARLGGIWGIRHLLHIAYRIVASHRRRFNSVVK